MIRYVQNSYRLGGATNSAFLALIPKEKGASSFDRFRPISLCNVSYKIMAKIITNRLNPFLSSLILSNQGGFLVGRKIWYNLILVQEAIHSRNSRGEKGMVIKIDMANAFDRVNHEFLKVVLKKFGFNQSFISWANSYISNPWIAPLINGRPAPFFKASRGLRQGCPMSPLFYVLMSKSLNRRLEWEHINGSIPGLRIARRVKRINHSQFVDDTLLLGGASKIMARRFKLVLDQFIQIS